MRLPCFIQNAPRAVLLAAFTAVVALMTLWFHLILAAPLVVALQAESDALLELPPAVAFTLGSCRRLSALMLPLGAIIGVFSVLSIWRGAPETSQRAVRFGLVVLALVLVPLAGWISVCTFIGAQNLALSERQRSLLASHALQDLATFTAAHPTDATMFERAVEVNRRLIRGPARELRLLTVADPGKLPMPEQQNRAIALIQWLELSDEPALRRTLLAASLSWRGAFEAMKIDQGDVPIPVERLLQHARRALPDQEFPSAADWFDWLEQQNRDQTDWSRPPVLRLALPEEQVNTDAAAK